MKNTNIYIKLILSFMCFTFLFNNIFAVSYVYDLQKQISSVETEAAPTFNFQSTSQVLMEASTGKILYANNENERLLPASVTKIMTLLLLMEDIDAGKISYTDKVSCSQNASSMGGSQIWFKEGEELTIDECLKAICVVSANDVTVAVAEKLAGNEENFVVRMNEKAKELGMTNTNFMNCHGIDEENHYTSAMDIAIMSRELITKHPDILKYTSIWMDSLRDGTFGLTNTNKLIRFYEGAVGLKTGSTSQALFNLSGCATRNGTTFISVIMKAPSSDVRLSETKELLDYGFANYEIKDISKKDTILQTGYIDKNVEKEVNFIQKDDIKILTKKGTNMDTYQEVEYNEDIKAPLKAGDVVGKMCLKDNITQEVVGTSDIIVNEDVPKSNYVSYLKKLVKLFLCR